MNAKIPIVAVALAAGLLISALLPQLVSPTSARTKSSTGYERIVSISPAVTEIIFALGEGGRVVGVDNFVEYPPEAAARPRCGGWFNPDRERILSLGADAVIAQGISASLRGFCQANQIDFVSVQITDLESIFQAVATVGRSLGAEEAASRLVTDMKLELSRIRAHVADHPAVSVFILAGREPDSLDKLFAVGSGGFINDLVAVAGGSNIFFDVSRKYSEVSKESLLVRMPQVVVELRGEGKLEQKGVEEIKRLWQQFPSLPAVKDGRVHVIDETYAMIPGPRVVKLAARFAEIFHGEPGR